MADKHNRSKSKGSSKIKSHVKKGKPKDHAGSSSKIKSHAKKGKPKDHAGSAAKKQGKETQKKDRNIIDEYKYDSDNMPITIKIYNVPGEFVPIYEVSVSAISETTEMILDQIRKKLIREVSLGILDITNIKKGGMVEDKFKETISVLIDKYFPDVDQSTKGYLTTYLIQRSLGMGNVEILMNDKLLEEIVINQATDPVWIYHKKHGWLKTNIVIPTEEQVKHYATMIGRKVGRQISVLEPLLDAHLNEGDRVNATLMPISTSGNTITIRKFSRDPFTITHFLRHNTLSLEAAALIWLAMQYELSALIAGGTASGKTSTLNVLATFFPPNQRIISIEDTREIRLPKFLHWVPMNTRQPNAEGKGEVSMEDLLVNALRQRPDRILVGEVRRKREAETLFESIHTGHSCYATFHANNVAETINRLCNPPIDVPKTMLPAISMIIIQFRNRRTGTRRTFQIAEVLPDSSINIIMQYDAKKDKLIQVSKSKSLMKTLELYTGNTQAELQRILKEKVNILKYMIKMNIDTVDGVGRVMAEYYTNKDNLMRYVRTNKLLGD
ncbi:type II/IV secretion system ATPase subunit [Candidatus Woesearchaeota archaeon]|nr:type II/IV secretion system ATPase subunit [Candidatus Woesearchaeota archaeon]